MAKSKKAPKAEKTEVVAEAATEAKNPLVKVHRENYTTTKSASGSKSLSNGDTVAVALEGLDLDEVYGVAEGFLVFPLKVRGATVESIDEMRESYASLNDGMQRMNIGNRLRKRINALDKALEKAEEEAQKEGGKPVPKTMQGGEETLSKVVAPFHKARDARLKEEEKAKAKAAKQAEAA